VERETDIEETFVCNCRARDIMGVRVSARDSTL